LRHGKLRRCSEIPIDRFEGRDEKQTPIIFAFLNLDSHTCRKSAFARVSPDTAKRLSGRSTGGRIGKPPDDQHHLPMQ
jgi:hypothetical protein